MTEVFVYEVTISLQPLPKRGGGVLKYTIPIQKTTDKDILDYGRELTELIRDYQEMEK